MPQQGWGPAPPRGAGAGAGSAGGWGPAPSTRPGRAMGAGPRAGRTQSLEEAERDLQTLALDLSTPAGIRVAAPLAGGALAKLLLKLPGSEYVGSAAGGALGEFLAQRVEGRDETNLPSVAIAGGINLIPTVGRNIARTVGRSALTGAAGQAGFELAEHGLDATLEDLPGAAGRTAFAGAAGGVLGGGVQGLMQRLGLVPRPPARPAAAPPPELILSGAHTPTQAARASARAVRPAPGTRYRTMSDTVEAAQPGLGTDESVPGAMRQPYVPETSEPTLGMQGNQIFEPFSAPPPPAPTRDPLQRFVRPQPAPEPVADELLPLSPERQGAVTEGPTVGLGGLSRSRAGAGEVFGPAGPVEPLTGLQGTPSQGPTAGMAGLSRSVAAATPDHPLMSSRMGPEPFEVGGDLSIEELQAALREAEEAARLALPLDPSGVSPSAGVFRPAPGGPVGGQRPRVRVPMGSSPVDAPPTPAPAPAPPPAPAPAPATPTAPRQKIPAQITALQQRLAERGAPSEGAIDLWKRITAWGRDPQLRRKLMNEERKVAKELAEAGLLPPEDVIPTGGVEARPGGPGRTDFDFGANGSSADAGGEAGFVSPELLQRLGLTGLGGAVGAGYGATQGDNARERWTNAVGYGLLGGTAGFGLAKGAQGGRQGVNEFLELLQRARYFSMLTGLGAQSANLVGGLGAGHIRALEEILQGNLGRGGAIARNLWSPQTFRRMVDAYHENAPQFDLDVGGHPTRWGRTEGLLGQASRVLHSVDQGYTDALERAGLGLDEARDTLFTNTPHSRTGQDLANRGPLLSQIIPFVKTASNLVERGLEHTPLVGSLPHVAQMRNATPQQQAARQALGALAIIAGGSGLLPDEGWQGNLTEAGLGPLALPSKIGREAKARMQRGKDPARAGVEGLVQSALDMAPMVTGLQDADPSRWVASFVPGALGNLAEDPVTDFDRSGTLFDPAIAKIPVLQRILPRNRSRQRRRSLPTASRSR